MKKGGFFALVLFLIILITSGCGDTTTGRAVQERGNLYEDTTTTQTDDITAKFNEIVNGVETDKNLDEIDVEVVSDEDDKEVEEETTTTTEAQETTTTETTTTTEPEPQENEVIIKNNEINPVDIYIKVGDSVKWINNEDKLAHMVSSIYSKEFRSERLVPGDTFEHTFNEKGEFQYIDAIVPDKIRGRVIVE
ncbi:MAG: cupredoxin domain-containing protein [Candidatus Woesearchaeota archaeon]